MNYDIINTYFGAFRRLELRLITLSVALTNCPLRFFIMILVCFMPIEINFQILFSRYLDAFEIKYRKIGEVKVRIH